MAIEVGVYAPHLEKSPQSAPLTCLKYLFEEVSKRNGVRVTHLHRGDPVDWDDSLHVPRIPGRCEQKINSADFDIVHFNTFVNVVSPKMLSAPSVLMYHGDVHWELPGVTSRRLLDSSRCILDAVKLPQYNQILTVSSDLKRRVRNRYSAFNIDPTTVYNGIDHNRFQPNSMGVPDSYSVTKPYVLHVSSYSRKKNPTGILKAFKRVQQRIDVELLICGGGWKENTAVTNAVRKLEIKDNITFAGYVPGEDLPGLYQDASVFVYPSLHESFGLPIVEAMACGTPVVTADTYAPPEIAADAALTCNPESPKEIAKCIYEIFDNSDLAKSLRKKGIQRANQFTWETAADSLLDAYRSL